MVRSSKVKGAVVQVLEYGLWERFDAHRGRQKRTNYGQCYD